MRHSKIGLMRGLLERNQASFISEFVYCPIRWMNDVTFLVESLNKSFSQFANKKVPYFNRKRVSHIYAPNSISHSFIGVANLTRYFIQNTYHNCRLMFALINHGI